MLLDVFKKLVGLLLIPFFFSIARCDPSFPPWMRLHWRWAMPDPSRPGVRSPVMASGGSWSALAPSGVFLGSVMSTGDPQRMQVGSQLASTSLTQLR